MLKVGNLNAISKRYLQIYNMYICICIHKYTFRYIYYNLIKSCGVSKNNKKKGHVSQLLEICQKRRKTFCLFRFLFCCFDILSIYEHYMCIYIYKQVISQHIGKTTKTTLDYTPIHMETHRLDKFLIISVHGSKESLYLSARLTFMLSGRHCLLICCQCCFVFVFKEPQEPHNLQ